ncbi:hypothetical protein [Marinivivus vitaminiproducens]|uniref:hypothetical protein n=1 Tax=Marinivivus vitaminiproducens TaxID=3035935 RepID=UPI0027A0BA5C|nr:hypothetical protein P4R82_05045 [Geminicoccaceae bacterium SCSIO 64248]
MSIDVAVLIIHGIGSQPPDFADPAIARINERLGRMGLYPGRVGWAPVHWADVLGGAQRTYLQRAERAGSLGLPWLRRQVVEAFGDAASYQRVPDDPDCAYNRIHARITEALAGLEQAAIVGGEAPPLVVLAHSLGGHIASNYIWDVQTSGAVAGSAFTRLHSLAGMITFGCNIPLFSMARADARPIRFPADQLPAGLRPCARWTNIYDPQDVLGYPLKPINAAYAAAVTEDLAMSVGGWLSGMTPAAHTAYWSSAPFISVIAERIALLAKTFARDREPRLAAVG